MGCQWPASLKLGVPSDIPGQQRLPQCSRVLQSLIHSANTDAQHGKDDQDIQGPALMPLTSTGLVPTGGSGGENAPRLSPGFWSPGNLSHSPACRHITLMSASVFTWPSSLHVPSSLYEDTYRIVGDFISES